MAYLLRKLGEYNWWLSAIPIVGNLVRYTTVGVPLSLVIAQALFAGIVLFFSPFYVWWWLALKCVSDYIFAKRYLAEGSPLVYTLVPFAKYYLLMKGALDGD